MNDPIAEVTPVATPAAVIAEPTAPIIPADNASLADHETAFGADGTAKEEPKRRHRVKDIATPADVPRIAELTKKFRTAEQERDDWKAKYEAATKPAPEPVKPASLATAPTPPPAGPAEKFAFASFDTWSAANPNGSWDDWDDAKADARDVWRDDTKAKQAAQQQHLQQQTASETAAQQAYQKLATTYQWRVAEFVKTTKDFAAKIEPIKDYPLPPIMEHAILTADNGPQLVYTLAQRPDLLAEMHLIGDGKPLTDAAVASAQRWLVSRVQAVATGSAVPPVQQIQVPRPPNPVRTGPQSPSDDPPGDGASLRDHERYYGPATRR